MNSTAMSPDALLAERVAEISARRAEKEAHAEKVEACAKVALRGVYEAAAAGDPGEAVSICRRAVAMIEAILPRSNNVLNHPR